MDDQTWSLLMDKLERIEKQNDDQLELIRSHIENDSQYYVKTNRHETYFAGIFTLFSLLVPAVIAQWLQRLH